MKMMNSGFNSNTEISLRILLSLYASEEHLSVDELAICDFMTVYAKDFGITAYNLHGDNKSKESEYAARRQQVKEAIRFLVTQGYVDVEEAETGFLFASNNRGIALCDAMESTYSADYTAAAIKVAEYARHHDLEVLLSIINRKALIFHKEGNE